MPYALCPMPYARRVPHVTEKGYISVANYLLGKTNSFDRRSCGSLYCICFARSDTAGSAGNSLGSNIINRRIFAGFGSVVGSQSLVAANLRGNGPGTPPC